MASAHNSGGTDTGNCSTLARYILTVTITVIRMSPMAAARIMMIICGPAAARPVTLRPSPAVTVLVNQRAAAPAGPPRRRHRRTCPVIQGPGPPHPSSVKAWGTRPDHELGLAMTQIARDSGPGSRLGSD